MPNSETLKPHQPNPNHGAAFSKFELRTVFWLSQSEVSRVCCIERCLPNTALPTKFLWQVTSEWCSDQSLHMRSYALRRYAEARGNAKRCVPTLSILTGTGCLESIHIWTLLRIRCTQSRNLGRSRDCNRRFSIGYIPQWPGSKPKRKYMRAGNVSATGLQIWISHLLGRAKTTFRRQANTQIEPQCELPLSAVTAVRVKSASPGHCIFRLQSRVNVRNAMAAYILQEDSNDSLLVWKRPVRPGAWCQVKGGKVGNPHARTPADVYCSRNIIIKNTRN